MGPVPTWSTIDGVHRIRLSQARRVRKLNAYRVELTDQESGAPVAPYWENTSMRSTRHQPLCLR